MRITTQLRVISAGTIIALVVLLSALVGSFIEFDAVRNEHDLADTIYSNTLERTAFRDQYFLYREDRVRAQWDKSRQTADGLLHQAKAQIHREEDQQTLERLHRHLENTRVLFHRIVNNTETLRTAAGNRQVYEELDKRLYSQLLLKDTAVRDTATVFHNACEHRVELTYQHLIVIIGLFATMLALVTLLTPAYFGRLIHKRLIPLHDGAKIIADGGLDYRIPCDGADEFSELAVSVNTMTDKLAAEINRHQRMEAELLRSNTELEQFSYAISHDMRQPLRMISSYLQLLQRSLGQQLSNEQHEYFRFAIDGAKRLDTMLLGLLEYSRVGRKGEPPAWVESRAILDDALLFLGPAIAEAKAAIHIRGEWPRFLASPDELLRLIQNLIGNALKFRVAGRTPEITLLSTVDGDHWRLSVTDNGIGILPDQIGRLFQVFQRLQSRTAYEGTGIGLALCRKIVEHHGGRIWVASAGEQQGCVFTFLLPMANTTKTMANNTTAGTHPPTAVMRENEV